MIHRARVTILLLLGVLSLDLRIAMGQGFSAAEAAGRMSVADGLEVRLFASEPMVRQPVAIEFDDRGRLWVIQYLQYPNPEGLKRVAVDRYSRTSYDRIPEPPPRGPKGADRISILEDRDGDGRADRSHDFVSGLNLTSGLAFGYGGVFVLQTPYLLFYPDRDRDDRPDSDPEVLLSGFGMEDAHSVANSLTWGPDGWLYGLQGSTVTARVRGIEFQQGVWRYHPRTRRFELFCEGGGNMWGLDFDRHGQLFASTNVGGFVMLHGVQGGYYWKSFGKHGPLHNPYTFGYFDHVHHEGLHGGHVAVGGLFYEADTLPPIWRGRYIAADLLDHSIHAHELKQHGATHVARQVVDVLRANDSWFAPTDMTLGPDGALYVSDWHDKRTAHPDPDADWDRTNGRIFVITTRGGPSPPPRDLAVLSDENLVRLLDHPNVWYRRRARRLLTERHAQGVVAELRRSVIDGRGPKALEAFWTLYGCAGLDQDTSRRLLEHPDPDVRSWSIRLIGDDPTVSTSLGELLIARAVLEPDVTVRAQLASTARRLGPQLGLDLAYHLLIRDLDDQDVLLPLLLWWAVEDKAYTGMNRALDIFTSQEAWSSSMVRASIMGRLVRRYAVVGDALGDQACVRLLDSAPNDASRGSLLVALDETLRGRKPESVDPVLSRAILRLADREPSDGTLTRLAARLRNVPAIKRAREIAADVRLQETVRVAMLDLLGELREPASVGLLIDLAARDQSASPAIRFAALNALSYSQDDSIAGALLAAYPRQDEGWRRRVREMLMSRASWARAYLSEIDRGRISSAEMTLDQLSAFPALQKPDLAEIVRKHWGTSRGATREERLAEVRRLNNDLRAGPGDALNGQRLFRDRCATCHRLRGEGETIGPDLTFANRKDRDFLLVSLVDPSGVVRKEYQASQLATKDGRVFIGAIVEQSPEAIILRDAKGQRTRVARSDVDELKDSDVSLMPESLYKELRPQELRDLFRFLQEEPAAQKKDHP